MVLSSYFVRLKVVIHRMFVCFLFDFNRYRKRGGGLNHIFVSAIIEHTHCEAEKVKCGDQQIGQWRG